MNKCEECSKYSSTGMNALDCSECEIYNDFMYGDYIIHKDDLNDEFIKYIDNNWINVPILKHDHSKKYKIEQYAKSLGIMYSFNSLLYSVLSGYYHIDHCENDIIIIEPIECNYLKYIDWLERRIKWLESPHFKKDNIKNVEGDITTSKSMLNIMFGLIPIIEEVNSKLIMNNLKRNDEPIIRYTYQSEVLDDIKIAEDGKLRIHKYFAKNKVHNLDKSNCKNKHSDLKILKKDVFDEWGVKHEKGSYVYKKRIIEPTNDLDLYFFEIRAFGGLKLYIHELKELNNTISELIKLYDK